MNLLVFVVFVVVVDVVDIVDVMVAVVYSSWNISMYQKSMEIKKQ